MCLFCEDSQLTLPNCFLYTYIHLIFHLFVLSTFRCSLSSRTGEITRKKERNFIYVQVIAIQNNGGQNAYMFLFFRSVVQVLLFCNAFSCIYIYECFLSYLAFLLDDGDSEHRKFEHSREIYQPRKEKISFKYCYGHYFPVRRCYDRPSNFTRRTMFQRRNICYIYIKYKYILSSRSKIFYLLYLYSSQLSNRCWNSIAQFVSCLITSKIK